MRSFLSPEARFLVLTTRGEANDQAMRDVLAGPFDWAALCRIARADNALPVVWRCLRRLEFDVPAPVAEYLSGAAAVSEFELLRAEIRLRETLHAFDEEGIRVVLLKGAAVVQTAYKSVTERPMSDFDVLIEPGKIDDAQRIAGELGWARIPGAAADSVYALHHHAAPLVDSRGTGMRLELHTGLFISGHPFGLSPDVVRRRARPVAIEGRFVGVPSRAVLMVHACLHFAWSHCMKTGAWRTMRDIARLAEDREHVWEEFIRLAIETRGTTCCYWTLRLARELADMPVPERVMDALKPPLPESVLNRLARHFALHLFAPEGVCPSEFVERTLWAAAIMPGWSGHSATRPWTHTHGFVPARPMASRVSFPGTRLASHARRLPQWGRYLRVMLKGSRIPALGSLHDGA
jgi:hypothetical protein